MKTILFCLLFGFLALVQSLTFVPVADEDLVANADTVVVATPLSSISANAATTYEFLVQQTLKGNASTVIHVRVPGGYDQESNSTLTIPGAPEFQEGDNALLFLVGDETSYAIEHFQQGAFLKVSVQNSSYAFNRASDVFDSEEGAVARDFDEFVNWVKDTSSNKRSTRNYMIPYIESDFNKRFTLMGSPSVRWFTFDAANSIAWKNNGAISGLPASFFQGCMNVWNSNSDTPIIYVHNGQTSATGGLLQKDGINTVLIGDPRNEIAGSFSCATGGVVALGGWWTAGNAQWKGITFQKIVEGDIIFQDGVNCLLAKDDPVRLMSTFLTHELGHTLGLGHSCGDSTSGACKSGTAKANAVMRAVVKMPVPNVALSSDDVAGIKFLYGK